MWSPSRRVFLRTGGAVAVAGLGGCLGFGKSYPTTDLLAVNADEAAELTVHVTDGNGETLYEEQLTVPENGRVERDAIVSTGPIVVEAYTETYPSATIDDRFDFAGCRQARPVITVRGRQADKIGKQDTCRPDEATSY